MWKEDSTWIERGDGRFEGMVPERWSQGRASYGGIVAAVGVRCTLSTIGPERRLRSAMITFVGPLAAAPAVAVVEILREGRTLTQAMTRIEQDGSTRAIIVSAFGAPRDTGISLPGPARPAAAPPSEVTPMPYIDGLMPAFVRHFEFRWTVANFPFSGTGDAHAQGWFRLREDTPVDDPGLLGLFDSWPPPVWSVSTAPAVGSTVTWQVNVAGGLPVCSMSDWWFYESRAVASQGGHCDFESRVWSPDGRLAAGGRQYFAEFSAGS